LSGDLIAAGKARGSGLKQDPALAAAVSTIASVQQRRLSSPFSQIEAACVVKPIKVLALKGESIGTSYYRQRPHLSQFVYSREHRHLTAVGKPHGSSRISSIQLQS
jgi:hypothetical protein